MQLPSLSSFQLTDKLQSRGKGRSKKKTKLTKAKKPKKGKPFRFLDLPAELRDEIYELALTDIDGITVVSRTKNYRRVVARGVIEVEGGNSYYYGKKRRQSRWARYWGRNDADSTERISAPVRSLVPNLLASNKQIRAEGGSYLYKQEIIVDDMTTLQTFVAQIGQYNRDMLTEITIKGWGTGRGVHKVCSLSETHCYLVTILTFPRVTTILHSVFLPTAPASRSCSSIALLVGIATQSNWPDRSSEMATTSWKPMLPPMVASMQLSTSFSWTRSGTSIRPSAAHATVITTTDARNRPHVVRPTLP